MPYIKNSKTVFVPVKKIYQAFADIETYPSILKYIKSVRIIENHGNWLVTEIEIGASFLAISYQCRIDFEPCKTIRIEAISGPFRYLTSRLDFTAINARTTRIDYAFDSRFKSHALEKIAGLLFTSQFQASLTVFENHIRDRLK